MCRSKLKITAKKYTNNFKYNVKDVIFKRNNFFSILNAMGMSVTLRENDEVIMTELIKVNLNLVEKLLLFHSKPVLQHHGREEKLDECLNNKEMRLMQGAQPGLFSPH